MRAFSIVFGIVSAVLILASAMAYTRVSHRATADVSAWYYVGRDVAFVLMIDKEGKR